MNRLDDSNITCYVSSMNFSLHLNDDLVRRLNATAQAMGKSRNALIREAVEEWLPRFDSLLQAIDFHTVKCATTKVSCIIKTMA